MNDFQGLLSGDYGFKPQGKSAPMAPPRSNPSTTNSAFDFDLGGSTTTSTTSVKKAPYPTSSASSVFLDDQDNLFSRPRNSGSSRKNNDFGNLGGLDDVFGGSSKSPANSSVNLDSIFSGPGDSGSRFSSLPVFDKPVYDDDVFDGVSGLKSSNSAKYESVFSSSSSPPSKQHDAFDDLLGGLGRKEPESRGFGGSGRKSENDIPAFDDLLPGFGASTAPSDRDRAESSWDKKSTVNGSTKSMSYVEDPFVVLNSSSSDASSCPALYSDPLEQFTKLGGSGSKKYENVSASAGLFDDIDPLDGLGKSVPMNDREKVGSPARTGATVSGGQTSASVEASIRSSSARTSERGSEKKISAEDYHESPSFDAYSASIDSQRCAPDTPTFSYVNVSDETTSQKHTSTIYESNHDSSDDVWLTVSEIPLFTQPTAAPPPSRPPPPKPARISKARAGSYAPPYDKKKIDDHSSFPHSAQFFQSPKSAPMGGKSSLASPIDELEDFAKGRSWNDPYGNSDVLSGDDLERHSDAAASAAAMKEAMERAEARFKHAKEAREKENAKAARMQQEKEDKTISDLQEREFRERQERQERQERECQLREVEERKQREEEERMSREREEREREQRRIERERIERERVRQAVERATREARERAAAEARARAEKAAVEKAQAEARERAERAAVMKAQAEARERAARAAAEAKQRADREKAERAAREKAEREAKEKEARDKAAAAAVAAAAASARANQQKNENDLESFFGMGSRASSAPRPRASSSDPFFDSQFPKKQSESVRTSVGSTASMRKTSSSANIVDDLSSIFGGAPSAGAFQEVEGESEERRRARLERHQRTQERAAKALAEKNQRDLEAQKEQAERHRIAETLDVEIKRWAAGKEGNLRALLSTLQYVLWPECGWQPVSLTDLITAAAVKKVYRKATLCIHPDKVQQKGATLQQKYIAEKVFDLLKEAWNKFNSEELF